MSILLAVDGSDESLEAAKLLTRLPFRTKPEVSILTVLAEVVTDEIGREARTLEEEVAQSSYDKASEVLETAGFTTKHITKNGHPSRMIIQVAEEMNADMIALGARGHSAVYRVVLGSTADFVANHAKCSVLVVRPPMEKVVTSRGVQALSVLAAYDGSAPARQAFKQLAEFDWPESASIHLCTMLERPSLLPEDVIYDEDMLNEAEASLAELASTLSCKGEVTCAARETLHISSALRTLAERRECDLLVVGDTGKSAIGRFFLGSKSRYLLHHTHCSVWIARSKAWKGGAA